ncbi:MAG: TetR/AcrR family transcriptional regulator [Caldilineaceae bacterium]|nr:TetR/AcrR family transcriptional regulator [Caldilineaceae bacterium]
MMHQQQKTDRRSARSQQLLYQALMDLMLEKRYDKITVQDIIDRANVGRSTFYAHFQDKEDLLVTNFERMLESFSAHWLAHGEERQSNGKHVMSVAALFRHTQEYHTLYKALVWGRGIDLIYQQAQRYFSGRVATTLQTMMPPGMEPTMPLPMLANHIAATLGSLLRWWLEAEMPHSPDEMDDYFHQLVIPVVERVLGDEK